MTNTDIPDFQCTLKQPVEFEGKGLHTGKYSQITIRPAKQNSGVVFRRIEKSGRQTDILAHWKNTKKLPLCTCLKSSENGVRVRTIEHLMAAFYACGVDNALIEIKGEELPILDGSSQQFVEKINKAGLEQQESLRRVFAVTREFEVHDGDAYIKIEPEAQLNIDMCISLQKIGRLYWRGIMTPPLFLQEITPARTFGRLKSGLLAQLTRFSDAPICLGANTSSAIVLVRGDKVLNKEGLRMPDEFVRHRLLDLMGDLMLSGGHIQGKISALSPAHRMTHELLRQIFTEKGYVEVSASK